MKRKPYLLILIMASKIRRITSFSRMQKLYLTSSAQTTNSIRPTQWKHCFHPTSSRPILPVTYERNYPSCRFLSSLVDLSTEKEELYLELQRLSEEIRRHDQLYYNQQPILSDEEYDALVRSEEELCKTYPDLMKKWEEESGLGSQATRYGGRIGTPLPLDGKEKRKHLRPMLSLDNINNREQLFAWLERIRKKVIENNISRVSLITEPKLDGLSLSLRYQRKSDESTMNLVWASTRGDGRQGQDVTAAVLEGEFVPKEFRWENAPENVEVRGEVILPKTTFEMIAADLAFSNARNAASGILLRKEQEDSKKIRAHLQFYAYDIIADESQMDGLQQRQSLSSFGFQVPDPYTYVELNVSKEQPWNEADVPSLINYHEDLRRHREGLVSRNQWGDYDMDGCVHKISEISLRKLLGFSTRAPRWATAHKFTPLAASTSLLDIEVQVGRTGALTPVAILQPVNLGGVQVQRATLHNFQHMQHILGSNKAVKKGSIVIVRRAGEVIPQIVHRIDTRIFSLDAEVISLEAPTNCPACGSPTISDVATSRTAGGQSSIGQILRCGGPPLLCRPRAIGILVHAFSREALDITGLSESRIEQLMDAGMLSKPSDLFDLIQDKMKIEKLIELEGWGKKSSENLAVVLNRRTSNGVSFGRFIYSLGIRHVGLHASGVIAAIYRTPDAFLFDLEMVHKTKSNEHIDDRHDSDLFFSRLRDESEVTKGIGPALLKALEAYAEDAENVHAARSLASKISVVSDETHASKNVSDKSKESKPFMGMSVVFTGSVADMARSEAQRIAKEMGAKATPNTVSTSTNLVVVGSKGGKKLEQAKKLGIQILDASDFIKMAESFLKQ